MLLAAAASAATAVATAQSVERDRLRRSLKAAEDERRRWARELHDETLQALGGLRVLLASTAGRGDADSKDIAIAQAIADVELEISNLRDIITDLRPALLDDLGLVPAIEALLDRRRDDALRIESELQLASAEPDLRLAPEIETTVYRLVQEALTNVVKHADASTVRVYVGLRGRAVLVEVYDDGKGFQTAARSEGFGLAGMRERVELAGGELWLQSSEQGTALRAEIPLSRLDVTGAARGLEADEMTS